MQVGQSFFLWAGVVVFLWVLYQSVTGRAFYKGKYRREENPPAFWLMMACEAIIGAACLCCGLGLTLVACVIVVLLGLMSVGFILWLLVQLIWWAILNPRPFWLWIMGRTEKAAGALQSLLAVHPDDQYAQFLLGSAYEKMGQWSAAEAIYTELAQTNDGWGRRASAILQNHGKGGRVDRMGGGR